LQRHREITEWKIYYYYFSVIDARKIVSCSINLFLLPPTLTSAHFHLIPRCENIHIEWNFTHLFNLFYCSELCGRWRRKHFLNVITNFVLLSCAKKCEQSYQSYTHERALEATSLREWKMKWNLINGIWVAVSISIKSAIRNWKELNQESYWGISINSLESLEIPFSNNVQLGKHFQSLDGTTFEHIEKAQK
jgi:hypothetical protein